MIVRTDGLASLMRCATANNRIALDFPEKQDRDIATCPLAVLDTAFSPIGSRPRSRTARRRHPPTTPEADGA